MVSSRQIKRSITISGHRTSISLEEDFWESLKEISREKSLSISKLVQEIDATRFSTQRAGEAPDISGLSSAIRVYVLGFYKNRTKGSGHDR